MSKQFLLNEFICNNCDQRFYIPDTPELAEYNCPKCGDDMPDDASTYKAERWNGEPLFLAKER
jgi:hypothetical protein